MQQISNINACWSRIDSAGRSILCVQNEKLIGVISKMKHIDYNESIPMKRQAETGSLDDLESHLLGSQLLLLISFFIHIFSLC
jgi:hypothetical protein